MTEPNLRFPAVFCENLRFSAKICSFLRFSAPSKCWNFQGKGRICENLRFSAKICVLWCSLSPQFRHLKRSLTFISLKVRRPSFLATISPLPKLCQKICRLEGWGVESDPQNLHHTRRHVQQDSVANWQALTWKPCTFGRFGGFLRF